MKEIEILQTEFRASDESAVIAHNRKMIEAAYRAIRSAEAIVSALSRTNHQMCKHEGSRSYGDRTGASCTDCPYCGGD